MGCRNGSRCVAKANRKCGTRGEVCDRYFTMDVWCLIRTMPTCGQSEGRHHRWRVVPLVRPCAMSPLERGVSSFGA